MRSELDATGLPVAGVLASLGTAVGAALLAWVLVDRGSSLLAALLLGGILAVFLLALIPRWPWLPYCLLLLVVANVYYVYAGPRLSVGSVSLWAAEVVLLFLIAVQTLAGLGSQSAFRRPLGTVEISMIVVVGGALMGCLVAWESGLSLWAAILAARESIFLLAFWLALKAFSTARGRTAAMWTAGILAMITVGLQVVQTILGSGRLIFVAGAYQNLVDIESTTGVVRVRPPGLTLVYIVGSFAAARLLWGPRQRRWLAAVVLIGSIVGLFASQNRNMLLGLPFGVLTAALLSRRPSRLVVLAFLLSGALVTVVAVAPVIGGFGGDSTAARLLGRAASITRIQEVNATSLSDRTYENGYAWNALRRSPLLGIGWGTTYGAYYQGQPRLWIHNQYLSYWLRFGLVPTCALVIALLAAIRAGARLQRHSSQDRDSWLGAGLVASVTALMASAFVGSYFTEPNSVVFLTGLLAFAAVCDPHLSGPATPAAGEV